MCVPNRILGCQTHAHTPGRPSVLLLSSVDTLDQRHTGNVEEVVKCAANVSIR